jgi:hypothetical protein
MIGGGLLSQLASYHCAVLLAVNTAAAGCVRLYCSAKLVRVDCNFTPVSRRVGTGASLQQLSMWLSGF